MRVRITIEGETALSLEELRARGSTIYAELGQGQGAVVCRTESWNPAEPIEGDEVEVDAVLVAEVRP